MIVGRWLLFVVDCSLCVVCCVLLVTRCFLSLHPCLLFVVWRVLLVGVDCPFVRCVLFGVVCCLLCRLLFVVCGRSLLVVGCS